MMGEEAMEDLRGARGEECDDEWREMEGLGTVR
jgi:hypothetical protein